MKKILAILLCSAATLASCKKSFIEIPPQATVTVDILYKTDKDFQDAVNGCYNVLQIQYQNFWVFGDLPADDVAEDIPNHFDHVTFDQFTVTDRQPILISTWRNYYNLINRANTIISNINLADASLVKNKDRYIGEAKFLRALAYFDLVRIFGDVPMITTNLTVEEAYKARDAISLGSLQAGMAFTNASVGLVHGMSRPIGALFHVPHGISNAMLCNVVTS